MGVLSFIGGTGPEGLGLAARFAQAGETIVIGSRAGERAQEAAQKLRELVPGCAARGRENQAAAQAGEIVFLTVPYAAQRELLPPLRQTIGGKIVVTAIAPLVFDKGRARAPLVEEGSAAQQAQALLPEARLVAAFQNLSAEDLLALGRPLEGDVIVCGDDVEAKEKIIALAAMIEGVRALDGGPLANARYVEGLTALLLNLNRRYKARTTVKILGIER